MNTYISVIFKIMDRFKKKALLAPEAVIFLNNQRMTPLYKPGGYFIFTDLTPGEACFEITSPVFGTEKVVTKIPKAGSGYVISHVMMNPSRVYPFGGPVTTVSGRLMMGNAHFGGQKFHMIPGDGGEVMKIAEDKAETGNCRIKLFAAVSERQLSIPGKYMIKDKDEAKREFCLIIQNADKEGSYPLENGLVYSHLRATPLVEVIECATSQDGSFFAVLPELKGGKAPLDILIRGLSGKIFRKSFEVQAYKENKFENIEIPL